MVNRFFLCLLVLLPWLGGCEKMKNTPVSVVNTPLVGDWYGEQRSQGGDSFAHDQLLVRLQDDGYVSYHFLSCEFGLGQPLQEKRLDLKQMPITRLNTVKMVLQSYPLTPKFELTLGTWPDESEGVWQVDNIDLRRVDSTELPAPEQWSCDSFSVQ